MTRFLKCSIVVFATSLFSIASAASGNSSDLLKYIPADTPYVFASLEPLPTEVADKFEPSIDEVLQAYQRVLRYAMAQKLVEMSSEEEGGEDAEQFRGVVEGILDLMSLEGIRGAGIGRDSAFALYGNGLTPVLRLELSDADLFDAAIERIEKDSGEALQVGEAKGQSYKYANFDVVNLVIASVDEQAIVTVVPAQFDESQVAMALGIDTPGKSLKRSKALRKIEKEYGFSGYLTGFIDNRRIAEIFTGDATGLDAELFATFDYTPPELTDSCSGEIMAMVEIAPRIVLGYDEITSEVIDSTLIVELREDLAKGLLSVPVAIPGLGIDPGGFVSIGFGFDLLALRSFFEARLDAMEADPYECEMFADLQAGVAKGREALNQPFPPVVYSFRGFVASIADFQGMDLSSNVPPESVDASILIAMENAESLIAMAAMMDPEIAALNLLPDGKPVKLELSRLPEFIEEAFAALSSSGLSVAVGKDAESKAADTLVADSANPAPFMSMSMDAERYYAVIAESMSQNDDDEDVPEAVRDALRDAMLVGGSMYERMLFDIRFTERGVELGGRMLLSD